MVGPHSFYEIMTRESSGKKNPSPTHSLSQYKTHFSELYDKVEKTWKEATKKQLLIKCEQEYENLCRIHEISLEERKDLVSASQRIHKKDAAFCEMAKLIYKENSIIHSNNSLVEAERWREFISKGQLHFG